MIPASLLLILVAVTLLALGLTGGSSTLLISSIVASLLAAIALVIGARQAASARLAAEADEPAAPTSRYDDEPDFAAAPEFVAEHEFAAAMAAEQDRRGVTDDPPPAGRPFAADSASSAPGSRDTVQFASVRDDERGDLSADEDLGPSPEPDYNRAASVINSARSEKPGADAWRRDPHASTDPAVDDRAVDDRAVDDRAGADPASDPAPADPAVSDPGAADPRVAGPAGSADRAPVAEADEFGEPDPDDPDDEPLPQSVRPADAVRVARMDAEVLVVDGRPRYHLPDCSHLVGRLTEPIPVNEAIELGFSPCGLCRPVERLAAAAARR